MKRLLVVLLPLCLASCGALRQTSLSASFMGVTIGFDGRPLVGAVDSVVGGATGAVGGAAAGTVLGDTTPKKP